MPNQTNKSNGKSGVVKPKEKTTMPGTQQKGTASSTKYSRSNNGKSVAKGSVDGGRKTISGGSAKA